MKSLLINEIEDTNNFSKKKKEEGVKDERTTEANRRALTIYIRDLTKVRRGHGDSNGNV